MLVDHKSQKKHGRAGGKARSPVKSLAARQNALLRWRGKKKDGAIPESALMGNVWYRDKNAGIALWDQDAQCFMAFERGEKYAVPVRRSYGDGSQGTFTPIETVGLLSSLERLADNAEEWAAIKSKARQQFHAQAATGWRFLPPTGEKDELTPFEAPKTLSL